MSFALVWNRIAAFLKSVPDWVWYVFVAIAAGKYIDMKARDAERKLQKARQAQQQAEEQARMERAAREVTDDLHDAREAASEARDSAPVVSTADELRAQDPGLAAIVFGSDRGDRQPGES